jgi:hypothetical protein
MRDLPWTPFVKADAPPWSGDPAHTPNAYFVNSRYQVAATYLDPKLRSRGWISLSIKRRDRSPLHDWRDLQRIKNEVIGLEREAVELYPAESRLVDTANQYWLWVLPDGDALPVGFDFRAVTEDSFRGSVQRPFDPDARPFDLESVDSLIARNAIR